MSSEKFTHGEWKSENFAESDNSYDYVITSDKGVVGYWRGCKERQKDNYWTLSKSDAHLISAAPDMYRLLKKMQGVKNLERDIDWDEVEQVLSKARGEQ